MSTCLGDVGSAVPDELHIVAVGGSDAGFSAALRARELDPTTTFAVVGPTPTPTSPSAALIGELFGRVDVGGDALGQRAQLIGAHHPGRRRQVLFGVGAGGLIDPARSI
jgi:hypothetical protein